MVSGQLLRALGKLGIRLVHSQPDRPQGRGKIERLFRTVREQFLVEARHHRRTPPAPRSTALTGLNELFTAWVETVYHHRVHSETGQTPLARFGRRLAGRRARPGDGLGAALTEAFLWSERRTVTKTATVSLHGNTYQVEAALVGRKVELVFSPFNLERDRRPLRRARSGPAVPHRDHPARPPQGPTRDTRGRRPAPATGIDYLQAGRRPPTTSR